MTGDPVRLVELLGALSLACDAADGFAPETTVRSAVLAGALAEATGLASPADVVVGGLLRHIGCTGFAVEEAHRYGAGDDVGLRRVMAEVDFGQPERAVATISERLAADAPAAERDAAVGALLGGGASAGAAHDAAQCDAGEHLAALLPVGSAAAAVARDAFERFDGHGGPAGRSGDEIDVVARIVEVGYVAELFRSRQGRGGAVAELRLRAGGQLDPSLVEAFLAEAARWFDAIEDPARSAWDALLEAEPPPHHRVSGAEVDAAALAFARFSDMKSVWFLGHSESVAALASAAAAARGMDAAAVATIRRAGLLHDLGRVAVPTGTWDLPRALRGPERDRVRFHSWETHRILSATGLFAPLAAAAGGVHERLDGGGYHRGVAATGLDDVARLLAAADVAVALGEHRPHRPAFDRAGAAAVLSDEVAAGRLDRDAVAAVLDAGGGPPPVALRWPDGLTDREVEVVRLLATGATNKDIARHLGISDRTVAHHVAHAYDKTGCRSRAGMTLYALERGLVGAGATTA